MCPGSQSHPFILYLLTRKPKLLSLHLVTPSADTEVPSVFPPLSWALGMHRGKQNSGCPRAVIFTACPVAQGSPGPH